MSERRATRVVIAVPLALMLCTASCFRNIAFHDDGSWSYRISFEKIDTTVLTIISNETLAQKYMAPRTFRAGLANTWEIEPGKMLDQVARVELPQTFTQVRFAEPDTDRSGDERLVLRLDLGSYGFVDGAANVVMRVQIATRSGKTLLQKDYLRRGSQYPAKEYVGAWGMKSLIRQSSLDAFKGIFADLRKDLSSTLRP